MANIFSTVTPPTPLGRYRVLGPNCGLRVSPLQLGAMSIGDKWEKFGMGAMNKDSSFKLLDAYFDAGGNFIDTASSYQDGSSEEFIGEWAEKRGVRDQLVIATKYSYNFKRGSDDILQNVNFIGNNVKSMNLSIEASLKKLRTSYIDIFYLHFWDYVTGVEEVMNALHNLVTQGKVLYLGISDTPAWVVAKANQYARYQGKTPFVIYQGSWNCLQRDFERDIIPMARSEGLALAPWNTLAYGHFRTDAEEERRRATGERGRTLGGIQWERSPSEKIMSAALEKVAKEVGTPYITVVAIAYLMHKTPYVFPIIGGRKVEHLMQNIEALKISLTKEHIQYIENAVPFDPGWPANMIGNGLEDCIFIKSAAIIDRWPAQEAIRPSKY